MVVDLFLVYQFIRRLATPFKKWDAYKLGIIDENGKVLIKRKQFTRAEQRKAWGVYDIMIANLKKLLAKVPGGSSRIASYAAALFLLKEYKHFSEESLLNEDLTDDQLDEALILFNERYSYYIKLEENVNHLNEFDENILEKLKASDDMGDWIDDFYKSDAPQFKGKSKAKRRQMAIAAKLDAMDESINVDEARGSVKPPRWKRAGSDGEVEIKFPTGRMFKVEKQFDENDRHKGEWKVMEYKTGGWVDDWEWVDTYRPKGFAKQKAMQLGQFDKKGKKVADYSSTFQYESVQEASTPLRTLKLINRIKKSGVVKSGSMSKKNVDKKQAVEEEPTMSAGSGAIAGIGVGPQGEPGLTPAQMKKYKKKNKGPKRLRDIIGANS